MKAQSLAPADSRGFRFTYVVGIGGIGTGVIFKFSGNGIVGRNESRLAELTSERDYCKLHIVLQSLSSLFGGPENDSIRLCAVEGLAMTAQAPNCLRTCARTGFPSTT